MMGKAPLLTLASTCAAIPASNENHVEASFAFSFSNFLFGGI